MLGPLKTIRSGQVISLGGRQQRAVLAMLLVEANKVSPRRAGHRRSGILASG
jgi:DNA-binding SARP family transcriptional activator